MGVDELGVDKMGVDEMGSSRSGNKPFENVNGRTTGDRRTNAGCLYT